MKEPTVLRFHRPDRVMHFAVIVCWALLGVSGVMLGHAARTGSEADMLDVAIHFAAGIALILFVAWYFVQAPERVERLIHEIRRPDRPLLAWFRTLGGYPAALLGNLGLSRKTPATVPQGRFNAGQRVAYAILILCTFTLLVTGALLFSIHQPGAAAGSGGLLLTIHGLAFKAGVLVLLVHVPMALLSPAVLRAVMPGSDGRIPYAVACRHSPLWVTEDLEPHGKEPGMLVEKELRF